MKKTLFLLLVLFSSFVRADEGMWLPIFIERLNYVDMQKEGLKLTPEEIYSINNSSLKDAIIQFGGGCTGEIISSKGLILTNHHCGYGAIQSHSTIDHDYLANGFWAMSMKEELPNEGLTARFLVRIEDVTKTVLEGITNDMTETERAEKIRAKSKLITDDAENGTGYQARVASFFAGNEYYLFVYEVFRDVRFVGAPPSSIGKFGADTDNWMWPRHTGDFSLFRVYTGPDGKPADYAENNIPLKPRHYLPVSTGGVEQGDFSMIMGYPGSTERFMTSWGVNNSINNYNPTFVNVRAKKLSIMRQDMDADREVGIKYASKYASTANYWKYFTGQTRGLKRLKVYDEKLKIEEEFSNWINSTPERKALYGNVLADFASAYQTIDEYTVQRVFLSEAIFRGADIMSLANSFTGLANEMKAENPNTERLSRIKENLGKAVDRHFKNYNLPTDIKMLTSMLNMYYDVVPVNQQPAEFRRLIEKNKHNYSKLVAGMFEKSMFDDQTALIAFLANPDVKKLEKDPVFNLVSIFRKTSSETQEALKGTYEKLQRAERLFIAGLREMQPDRKFYPDANSTMRLTYGKVMDYYPADAIHYDFVTTMKGIMEKEDPDNWEFVVPEKLKQLYEAKDFGPYGINGEMPVCFITTHDITGGNSGSPVLNAYGELIGLAFDGNWEAMSGDIAFEPELQRTINVDARYILFIIDKYAGAKNIIDELTLVKRREHKVSTGVESLAAPVGVTQTN